MKIRIGVGQAVRFRFGSRRARVRVGKVDLLLLTTEVVMHVAARREFTGVTYVLWFGFYLGSCKRRKDVWHRGCGERCSPVLLLLPSSALFLVFEGDKKNVLSASLSPFGNQQLSAYQGGRKRDAIKSSQAGWVRASAAAPLFSSPNQPMLPCLSLFFVFCFCLVGPPLPVS